MFPICSQYPEDGDGPGRGQDARKKLSVRAGRAGSLLPEQVAGDDDAHDLVGAFGDLLTPENPASGGPSCTPPNTSYQKGAPFISQPYIF